MKCSPKIGLTGQREFVVNSQLVIDFTQDGMPAVLSTPALIGLLERTAREVLAECLDAGENSVGIEIELRHLAPTPLGRKVVCTAKVIHADGGKVTFQIEASDEVEVIARGVHKRQVIRVVSFAKRVGIK